jgi:hypothetical protein
MACIDLSLIIHDDNKKTEVEEFICGICCGIMTTPIIVCKNGHCFGENCTKTMMFKDLKQCPLCKENIFKNRLSKNIIATNIIKKYNTHCVNNMAGCKWTDIIDNIVKHKNDCIYEELTCVNKDCNEKYLKKDTETHKNICNYRNVKCNFCQENFIFNKLKSHEEICTKRIIECVKCHEKITSDQLNNHTNYFCDYSNLPCKYKIYGCKDMILRKDMFKHHTDKLDYHKNIVFDDVNTNIVANQINKYIVTSGINKYICTNDTDKNLHTLKFLKINELNFDITNNIQHILPFYQIQIQLIYKKNEGIYLFNNDIRYNFIMSADFKFEFGNQSKTCKLENSLFVKNGNGHGMYHFDDIENYNTIKKNIKLTDVTLFIMDNQPK